MSKVIRNAAVQEVDRVRPEPRTARVVEIGDGHCMVTYTGEGTVVKVPYNNLAPSHVGQVVLIDGPMGDRRIVEVMGRTSIEGRIEDAENFRFTPPLWFESMMEYPETVPAFMATDTHNASNSNALCSPMIAPRALTVVRLETRILETTSATLRMSLYRIGEKFMLEHVQTRDVAANSIRPGFNLANPLELAEGDIAAIMVSRAPGSTGVETLVRLAGSRPLVPPSREGQFMMLNLDPQYQGNSVTPDLFGINHMGAAVYGVCLTSEE